MVAEQAGGQIADWARGLRVGVTGHRLARLAGADLATLAKAAHAVLAQIDAQLSDGPPRHLISSLAEGADSIVADAALELGWRLDVVLPLPREDYAADFPLDGPHLAHDHRIAAANALFELPHEAAGEDERTAAYERAGRVMLAQSDIVFAMWDGQPARGRGGAAQIIAEAVLRGIPVITIDPAKPHSATLLWDGLDEHDFGQQSVETVTRGGLDRVPEVIAHLTRPPADTLADPLASTLIAGIEQPPANQLHRNTIAYPLLLTVMGVRPLRWWFRTRPKPATAPTRNQAAQTRDELARERLNTWFERADANAVAAGQTFRSAYVTNFALAALAVIVSLTGLALPHTLKPIMATIELATIGTVLAITRIGRHAHWHRRWLDQRHLAERLRCMLIANRLGELGLRRGHASEGSWVNWAMHAVARMTGLPTACVDDAYLRAVRADLLDLLDSQIAYLGGDAARMHTLEHRMHRLGTTLFVATALICVTMVMIELSGSAMHAVLSEHAMRLVSLAATIAGAALPACGAAIYGIRMQGDFAGIAERSATLAGNLRALRALVSADPLQFDVLSRRIARATDLMTDDLSTWLHTYRARSLALPG